MGEVKSIADYKIGDEIFRAVDGFGVFRYVVDGVRQYEDGVMLEVECQTCSHGWKCRVLLARNDYDRIHAVHMLNEDDDDRQRHFHCNEGLYFWPTHAEAREEGLRRIVGRVKERVSEQERRLAADKKYLAELTAAVESERAAIRQATEGDGND